LHHAPLDTPLIMKHHTHTEIAQQFNGHSHFSGRLNRPTAYVVKLPQPPPCNFPPLFLLKSSATKTCHIFFTIFHQILTINL